MVAGESTDESDIGSPANRVSTFRHLQRKANASQRIRESDLKRQNRRGKGEGEVEGVAKATMTRGERAVR